MIDFFFFLIQPEIITVPVEDLTQMYLPLGVHRLIKKCNPMLKTKFSLCSLLVTKNA